SITAKKPSVNYAFNSFRGPPGKPKPLSPVDPGPPAGSGPGFVRATGADPVVARSGDPPGTAGHLRVVGVSLRAFGAGGLAGSPARPAFPAGSRPYVGRGAAGPGAGGRAGNWRG